MEWDELDLDTPYEGDDDDDGGGGWRGSCFEEVERADGGKGLMEMWNRLSFDEIEG